MPNQFTEITTTSYGGRIINSIKGVLFGVIIFVASFGLLYWNEGRVDLSTIAKTATEIDATSVSNNSSFNGKIVSATGILDSNETIGDNLFLKPDRFIGVERKTEMYSWIEKSESRSNKNIGGSETTETTYTYTTDWKENPQPSSDFRHPEEHENPQKMIESVVNKVQSATLGVYKVEMSSVALPQFKKLQLNQQNISLSQGAILANDSYVFIGKNASSTFNNPQIGDLRVSYSVLYPGNTATILGKLDDGNISPYFDKKNNRLYRIFSGTRDEAISTLHSEYTLSLWIFRLVGFLMMWIGLSLLFGPISVLLDILPIFGALSRLIIGVATFIVSLVLTIVTIFVSMIIHNIIALFIALAVAVAIIIFVVMKFKKRKIVSQFTLPPTI